MTKELCLLCDELIEDERILAILKEPIIQLVNNGNITLNENTEVIEPLIEKLYESFNQSFLELINSIEILKNNYQDIYTLNINLFEKINTIATQYKLANDCWLVMNEDKELAGGISRLVALWLTSDYSLEEKEKYFNDITREIYSNDPYKIINSVRIVKSDYSTIYNFRKEFFDDLETRFYNIINNTVIENNPGKDSNNIEDVVDKMFTKKIKKIFSKNKKTPN